MDNQREVVEGWIAQGWSNATIAAEFTKAFRVPTSEKSVRRARKRWNLVSPYSNSTGGRSGVTVEGDNASVTSPVSSGLSYASPDDLLLERGLSPEEWEVQSLTVNEWDSPTGDIMKQLKANCRRRRPISLVLPAQIDINLPKPKVSTSTTNAKLVVMAGDQQAPFHDTRLHELFCEWLRFNKPDEGVLVGDTADLPKISRHPDDPEWAPTTQECVNAVGQILYDYRTANTDTTWTKLPGNHDERLRRAVIDRLSDFYGLRPAQVEQLPELPPIHDPRLLYRLDELGIKYIHPKGSYDHAQLRLSPYLAVRHGWLARKGSGSSALASLDHLGHSIVVGHTHRQSLVYQTKHDINGKPITNTACETGCMCRIEQGLGYAVSPDWQNGFATAVIWPDGTFRLEHATYLKGTLYYRDQRYS